MERKRKTYYITTALPYVNSNPHLGFALELVQADVMARYHRLLGEKVFFLTGTDEHGVKILKAAQEEGKDVRAFVNAHAEKFQDLIEILHISNNDFIRTSDKRRHWPAVYKVWKKLEKRGDIYKKKYRGMYCVGHEAFITKKDLHGGVCALHGRKPELIEEENYFFRLSAYTAPITKAIASDTLRIIPPSRKNEILAFAKKGLEDISFSRPRKDLPWGIPVPGDSTQTVYVWADALTNYISALGYAENSLRLREFWPADVQCIGKDILKFHAAIWPGMLLALGLALPRTIFVHGFITVQQKKMSKSLGNIIDPFDLVRKYGTDAVRYYLLREIPSTEDGDFTLERFEERYDADLAKGLGNLVARVTTLASTLKNNASRKVTAENSNVIDRIWDLYKKNLEAFRFNDALSAVWRLIGWCDGYIDKTRPWETKNQEVMYELLFVLANIASMLQPFLPETSQKIFMNLGIQPTDKKWVFHPIKSAPLFPRINTINTRK